MADRGDGGPGDARGIRTLAGIPWLEGISAASEHYDALLVDAWGVLHDGAAAAPGAVDCLAALARRARGVVILTNAARREQVIAAELEALGIFPHLYRQVVSSGELAWRALRSREDPRHAALGRRCYYLGPARSRSLLEGLDLQPVTELAQAQFVLNTGASGDPRSSAPYLELLRRAARLGLPMVCANPDREALRAGVRGISAGALAQEYAQRFGGEVLWHGKPRPAIYARARAALGGARRVLAIGDALATDIAGASAAGLDSLLVTGGIHAAALGEPPDPARLAHLCAAHGCRPDGLIRRFAW